MAIVSSRAGPSRWWAVFAAGIGVSAGVAALPLYTVSLFMAPLSARFGWKPADIGLAATFLYAGLLLSAFWCGRLVDRFGPRPVAVASAVMIAALLALLSTGGGSLALFYACFFAVGFLGSGTTTISYAKAITTRFGDKRGLALGLMVAGGSLAGMAGPPAVESIIANQGWRAAFLSEAVWALVPVPLILLFIRSSARQDQASPPPRAEATRLWEYRAFRLMSLANLLQAVTVAGMLIHALPMLTEFGVERGFATRVISAGALGALFGRIGGGYLLDFVPGHLLGFLLMLVGACALVGMGAGLNPVACYFVFGICVGSEGDVIAYICGKVFPHELYAKAYGSVYAFAVAGLALGPYAVRSLIGVTSGYATIVYVLAGLLVLSSVFFLSLGGRLGERRVAPG